MVGSYVEVGVMVGSYVEVVWWWGVMWRWV